MSRSSFEYIPPALILEANVAAVEHAHLAMQYDEAIGGLVTAIASDGAYIDKQAGQTVLYVLDGDIGNGEYDDYAHRLQLTFKPASKGDTLEDAPAGAISTTIFQPNGRQLSKFGVYVTDIELRRHIAMESLPANATRYDARNYAQFIHKLPTGDQQRYKVDPCAGEAHRLEVFTQAPDIIKVAYNGLIFALTEKAIDSEVLLSYAESATTDYASLAASSDRMRDYSEAIRRLPDARARIVRLAEVLYAAGTTLTPELAAQLMDPEAEQLATSALLNKSAYYHPKWSAEARLQTRLGWVRDNAHSFRQAVNAHIADGAEMFGQRLQAALEPSRQLVVAAHTMLADIQPPLATRPEPPAWRIARTM